MFKSKCIYYKREKSLDYYKIDFITICNTCGIEKKQFGFSIDYSPTENLYESPLVFCSNPKIKYELFQINSFWTSVDAINLVKFLNDNGLKIFVLYIKDKEKVLEEISVTDANRFIESAKYLKILFSKDDLNIRDINNKNHGELWRNFEIIELNFPMNIQYGINDLGTLYYINYCNEYIKESKIVSKSKEFKILTKKLTKWFKDNYYSGRGKQCADNAEEYYRLFGNSSIK